MTANKSNFAYMKNRILLTLLLLTNIYNLMAQEDSYLWLEEVDGKKAAELSYNEFVKSINTSPTLPFKALTLEDLRKNVQLGIVPQK